MNHRNIEIFKLPGFISTRGLVHLTKYEIKLKTFDQNSGEYSLVKYLVDYLIDGKSRVEDGDTISYGLWLLKFIVAENCYQVFELDDQFSEWVEGADNAVYYFEQQKNLCSEEGVSFNMPGFTQKIAISDGVLDEKEVQGIRYLEPEHMSGWYLTTSKYDGNINNMRVVPLQEIVVKRKDLLQFLALPAGYTFGITERNTCWIAKSLPDTEQN